MIIYRTTVGEFSNEVLSDTLVDNLEQHYRKKCGHGVSNSELNAWKHSLDAMDKVLRRAKIPENFGIALEYKVPQTAKRIDFLLSGYDDLNRPSLIVVELKQWSTSTVSDKEGLLFASRGGRRGEEEGPHPSYQAWSYVQLLKDFNENIYTNQFELQPCAYLHNHTVINPAVRDERYQSLLKQAPVFLKGPEEQLKLGEFIKRHIKFGDSGALIELMDNGKLRPSKALADVIKSILGGNEEFTLIDEQKVAYETIYSKVKSALSTSEKVLPKEVVIVRGGPGTGKSVIAVNLLARCVGERMMAAYVSKNAAPRAVYQEKMKGGRHTQKEVKALFKSSGSFVDCPELFDVLLTDEAHRLNEKSGLYSNEGENQILEIIRSAKVSVFFIDENQRVTMKNIGTESEILKHAEHCCANITFCDLVAQFRCNGSQDFIDWVDNVLGIKKGELKCEPIDMDVRIFDTAQEMHQAIRDRQKEGKSARVVAGYCWDWISKKNPELFDITLDQGAYQKQWNFSSYGSLWALASGIEEIGCIHTCQGLEFDYIGVILGPDLIVRDDLVQTDAHQRAKTDKSLFGWKAKFKKNQAKTQKQVDEIIKNTYRTLLTRGMKGLKFAIINLFKCTYRYPKCHVLLV